MGWELLTGFQNGVFMLSRANYGMGAHIGFLEWRVYALQN